MPRLTQKRSLQARWIIATSLLSTANLSAKDLDECAPNPRTEEGPRAVGPYATQVCIQTPEGMQRSVTDTTNPLGEIQRRVSLSQASLASNVSTLVLSGYSSRWEVLWEMLRHLNVLSSLDLSQLEPPPGTKVAGARADVASMTEPNLKHKGSAHFKLNTFSCTIFHLDPQECSTFTLMKVLGVYDCFTELKVGRLHLHPWNSGDTHTDHIKYAVREMLSEACLSLQSLDFVGFPLRAWPPKDLIDSEQNLQSLSKVIIHFRSVEEPADDGRNKMLQLIADVLEKVEGCSLKEVELRIPVDWCINEDEDDAIEGDEDFEDVLSSLEAKEFPALEHVVIGVYSRAETEEETCHDLDVVAKGLKRCFRSWDARGVLSVEPSQDMLDLGNIEVNDTISK